MIVTTGEVASRARPSEEGSSGLPGVRILEALAIVGTASLLGLLTRGVFDLADQVMVHLLAVVVVASRVGRVASMVAVVVAVVSLDFLFVPPFYTLAVTDGRHLLTFGVMGIVGLVVSQLTQRVRAQADAALERERRTAALHAMSRDLAGLNAPHEIAESATLHLRTLLDAEVSLVRAEGGAIEPLAGVPLGPRERAVAQWVVGHGQPAGLGTDTLPGGRYLFVPLRAGSGWSERSGSTWASTPRPGGRRGARRGRVGHRGPRPRAGLARGGVGDRARRPRDRADAGRACSRRCLMICGPRSRRSPGPPARRSAART